jgi:uncharacterized protein (DUF1778 family)
MAETQVRSERVDLRMTPAAKQTLQRAAAVSHKTLTEFLLDSGLDAAVATLADRRVFQLDERDWNEFMAALASPPSLRTTPGSASCSPGSRHGKSEQWNE